MAIQTVLHIDDDPETIGLVRQALSRAGYRVVDAYTGYSGLQAVDEYKPDAILLAMTLSDIDGWRIFEVLRENMETAVIPVIALIERVQSIDNMLGLQVAGIDEYLTKPFTPQQLLESIRKAIQGR